MRDIREGNHVTNCLTDSRVPLCWGGGAFIYLFSSPSGLAPLDHLARKANQLLLTDHVDPLMIFLSWWVWPFPGWLRPHPQGMRADWMDWRGFKITCHGLHTHQISTHWGFWIDGFESNGALHHDLVFIAPVEFRRLEESIPRSTEAGLVACGGPTPYWHTWKYSIFSSAEVYDYTFKRRAFSDAHMELAAISFIRS